MTTIELSTTATTGNNSPWSTDAYSFTDGSLAFASDWGDSVPQLNFQVSDALLQASWFEDFANGVEELLLLEANWNGGGERPIVVASVRCAVELVSTFASRMSRPNVVPVADGSVQLEWHGSDVSIEIEIDRAANASALVYSDTKPDFEEHEVVVGQVGRLDPMAFNILARAFGLLAN